MTEAEISIPAFRKPLAVGDIGPDYLALHHIFGADVSRRNNLALITDQVLVYAAGNCVVFEDIETGEKQYLMAIDEGGVACVAVHPSRKFFAVGCKGFQPNIYVYEYPEMKVSSNILTI
jgi:hypothetical protein